MIHDSMFARIMIPVRLAMQKPMRKCVKCGKSSAQDATIRKMSDCRDCAPGTCRKCCETGHGTDL